MSELTINEIEQPEIAVGSLLRQTRETLGLTIEEAATQLNLRPSLLNDLEKEYFDRLQVSTYRRGYLKAYARLLGLDEQALLNAHDQTHGRQEEVLRPTHFEPIQRPNRWGKIIFRLATLIVLLAIVLFTALWWHSRGNIAPWPEKTESLSSENTLAPLESNAAETSNNMMIHSETEAMAPNQPVTEPSVSASDFKSTASSSTLESSETPGNTNVPAAESMPSQTSSVGNASSSDETFASNNQQILSDNNPLTLKFHQAAWVEVRDANNQVVLTGIQPAESEKALDGAAPFNIIIGNADQVSVIYKNKPVSLNAYTSISNVARFTLGEAVN